MPDIVDAAQGGVVILLATIVTILVGAVGFLFRLVVKMQDERIKRSEDLTDRANETNDKMAEAFAGLKEVWKSALDELRKP
jgi:NADH:ubiquinone oxidoreductase subunit 6 (subunit J)